MVCFFFVFVGGCATQPTINRLLISNNKYIYLISTTLELNAFPKRFHSCRAANWNLEEPTWTGRMRLVSNGNNVHLKLEDKMTGVLFANCPVETYPGIAIESVSDSSRYFVIRVLGDNGNNQQQYFFLNLAWI